MYVSDIKYVLQENGLMRTENIMLQPKTERAIILQCITCCNFCREVGKTGFSLQPGLAGTHYSLC